VINSRYNQLNTINLTFNTFDRRDLMRPSQAQQNASEIDGVKTTSALEPEAEAEPKEEAGFVRRHATEIRLAHVISVLATGIVIGAVAILAVVDLISGTATILPILALLGQLFLAVVSLLTYIHSTPGPESKTDLEIAPNDISAPAADALKARSPTAPGVTKKDDDSSLAPANADALSA
jgi:hypothetical protein